MNINATLKTGDLLYRQKDACSPFEHVGIYLDNNRVLHNSPSNNTEIVSLADYRSNMPIKIVHISDTDSQILTKNIRLILEENPQYDPIFNNCEHIANRILHGRKYSYQLQSTVIGIALGAFIGNQTGHNSGVFGLIGGLLGCIFYNSTRQYDHTLLIERG